MPACGTANIFHHHLGGLLGGLGSQFWAGGIGSHLRSLRHCDETQSLHYPQPQICAKGADAEQIYADQCASCHGAQLEGQPDWKTPLPSGRLPAPPHDADGHTWHHPDDILFRIVKEGTAAIVGGGYKSDMPGFAVLSDAEIQAALAYIKSTWPERELTYQENVSQAR
ncbi:c-type cytochrome [Brevundimonas vancanneytii]|nr:cytochrome c [Brevundimonas vancanneytii]